MAAAAEQEQQKVAKTLSSEHQSGTPSDEVCILFAHQPLEYQRRGAESALTAVASRFGSQLFTALPQLWSHVTQPLQSLPIPREEGEGMQTM